MILVQRRGKLAGYKNTLCSCNLLLQSVCQTSPTIHFLNKIRVPRHLIRARHGISEKGKDTHARSLTCPNALFDRNAASAIQPASSLIMFIINWFWDVLAQLGLPTSFLFSAFLHSTSRQVSCIRMRRSFSWAWIMPERQYAYLTRQFCLFNELGRVDTPAHAQE